MSDLYGMGNLVPNPDAPQTLTAEDHKQIKNDVISVISHSADVAEAIRILVRSALVAQGVLTGPLFLESDEVYHRLRDTVYEQAKKVKHEP